jgi:ABC-type antimicrobial peptide transport system permease subunit
LEDAVYDQVNPGLARSLQLVARSNGGTGAALRALRELARGLDAELPVREAVVAERMDDMLDDPRRWTAVLGAFAAVGMALAALGIFGLMSYVVRQRRQEIGVRLALGAQPASVARLIVTRGMRYALLGTGLGLLVTLVAVRRMESLLFGVRPTDLGTLAGVALLLLTVALVACWLPGRRAARIRPVEAIRGEGG